MSQAKKKAELKHATSREHKVRRKLAFFCQAIAPYFPGVNVYKCVFCLRLHAQVGEAKSIGEVHETLDPLRTRGVAEERFSQWDVLCLWGLGSDDNSR